MARGEHLTAFDVAAITALAADGASSKEIAALTGRSSTSIWRVINGRVGAKWRGGNNSSFSEFVPLEINGAAQISSGCPHRQEAPMLTNEDVRLHFVDVLAPHFCMQRATRDRFVADLAAALIDGGFSVRVLDNAATHLIRTRSVPSFPRVATCVLACRNAQAQLRSANGAPPSPRSVAGSAAVMGQRRADSSAEAA